MKEKELWDYQDMHYEEKLIWFTKIERKKGKLKVMTDVKGFAGHVTV